MDSRLLPMTGTQARGDFLPLRLSLVVLSVALGSPLAFSQSTAPNLEIRPH